MNRMVSQIRGAESFSRAGERKSWIVGCDANKEPKMLCEESWFQKFRATVVDSTGSASTEQKSVWGCHQEL